MPNHQSEEIQAFSTLCDSFEMKLTNKTFGGYTCPWSGTCVCQRIHKPTVPGPLVLPCMLSSESSNTNLNNFTKNQSRSSHV